jgi:hypothetical protein
MRPMPGLRVSHPARALHAPITPGSTISLRVVGRVVEQAESRVDYHSVITSLSPPRVLSLLPAYTVDRGGRRVEPLTSA